MSGCGAGASQKRRSARVVATRDHIRNAPSTSVIPSRLFFATSAASRPRNDADAARCRVAAADRSRRFFAASRTPATWGFTHRRCGFTSFDAPIKLVVIAARSPINPAGDSACATDAFVAPRSKSSAAATTRSGSSSSAATATAAPISIGSPRGVPVPCVCSVASRRRRGAVPVALSAASASRLAARMTARCDGPFGAVREPLLPSWFTPEPTTTTTTTTAAAAAAGCDDSFPPPGCDDSHPPPQSSASTTQASPRTYPSALASKDLHRPSGASMPAAWNIAVVERCSKKFTPATTCSCRRRASPRSSSRRSIAARAACVATSPDEHAVSIAIAGPRVFKVNAHRPAVTERNALPVAAVADGVASASDASLPGSSVDRCGVSNFASESAREVHVNSRRCCGSIACASEGLTPNASASNRATRETKPPNRGATDPDAASPPPFQSSISRSHRDSGRTRTASEGGAEALA
eukprot:30733-Pelagococcus_subviridis.AAC.1